MRLVLGVVGLVLWCRGRGIGEEGGGYNEYVVGLGVGTGRNVGGGACVGDGGVCIGGGRQASLDGVGFDCRGWLIKGLYAQYVFVCRSALGVGGSGFCELHLLG
jgi:hypothetical protein